MRAARAHGERPRGADAATRASLFTKHCLRVTSGAACARSERPRGAHAATRARHAQPPHRRVREGVRRVQPGHNPVPPGPLDDLYCTVLYCTAAFVKACA
eukprot:1185566-Prorocentrum_minimum.AAC.1